MQKMLHMNVIETIKERYSTRAFLQDTIKQETLHAILETARWAPSGVNSQPWKVVVLGQDSIHTLAKSLTHARVNGTEPRPDYTYYPEHWKDPYLTRRRTCGLNLYRALGIGAKDREQQIEAWNRNYRFFDAPNGLLFFIDKDMQTGSWIDMGMFMQNIMLAAKSFGLDTCPQASLAEYPDIVRAQFKIESNWWLLAGMAIGYADPTAAVNQYRLPRESVDNFTQWYV
jgi:nitroreductase